MAKQTKQMSENDIRPAHLLEGQIEAYNKDILRLQKELPNFVSVPCPACGGKENKQAFSKFSFKFVECHNCRTIFMSPRPTPGIMASYYQNSENYRYWAKYIFPASEAARKERLYKPWVTKIKDICSQRGIQGRRLVEIGAGFGGFAQTALESGFFDEVLVIEPTPELASACRQRGLTVIEKTVEDVEANFKPADILVSFEVIEHLFEPKTFFAQAQKLLATGGILIVSCPNGQGFDIQQLGALSDAVDSEHVNLFNTQSIQLLLEEAGFINIDIHTPGKLDVELVRKAILDKKYTPKDAFIEEVLVNQYNTIGSAFQSFLVENNLSSHMWAYAQKG